MLALMVLGRRESFLHWKDPKVDLEPSKTTLVSLSQFEVWTE